VNSHTAFERIVRSLDQRIRDLASRESKIPTYEAPTLLNSWANVGGAYANAGYYSFNQAVYLRGRVSGGSVPSDIFTLPANYRPASTLSFTVVGNGSFAIVDVEADGSVRAISGGGPLSLDGISFRVA
jgi:hypothetical protein